jgi:hypothetical protein
MLGNFKIIINCCLIILPINILKSKNFRVLQLSSPSTQGVFGWSLTFEKAVVGCGLWKSSCEKVVVGKAEVRLVLVVSNCRMSEKYF